MTRRLILYSCAALALGAVWLFVLHQPLVERRMVVTGQTQQAQEQLADYVRTIAQLPDYLKTSEALAAQRQALNSSLYAKDDILALLERIATDAGTHDLAVLEISPPVMELIELNHQSSTSGEPQAINLTIDLRGQYGDFGRFVEDLEQQPYFRSMNQCSIRGGQDAQPELDFSIGFKALLGVSQEAG